LRGGSRKHYTGDEITHQTIADALKVGLADLIKQYGATDVRAAWVDFCEMNPRDTFDLIHCDDKFWDDTKKQG